MGMSRTRRIGSMVFLAGIALLWIWGGEARALLPPILAIGLALFTREVLTSLFCGLWSGAALIALKSGSGHAMSLVGGFFSAADTYLIDGLYDKSHLMIIVFSLAIGGMVGVVTRSGGMQGLLQSLSRRAKTRKQAQLVAWGMGLLVFFDDYANTLIVGNAVRPLTDRLRVSREKLSFIVDSTSAPVASIAVLSTWIGYELGLIGEAFGQVGIAMDPYMAFLYSLPYRFYALLLLIAIPIMIYLGRDRGAMYRAEQRAIATGQTAPPSDIAQSGEELAAMKTPPENQCRWYNAVVPIGVLMLTTVAGIVYSGMTALKAEDSASWRTVLAGADSFAVLMWAALLGSATAIVMMVIQRLETMAGAMNAWLAGVKSMMTAVVILALAWGLSAVTKELGTATYVCSMLSDSLPAGLLPVLVFIIAGFTSFATGTSWGTMAILFPIAVPLAHALAAGQGMDTAASMPLLYGTIGAVLTGAIWGDHCSPISDTTIMASMASQVDHMAHVTTQLPYAATFGLIAAVAGYLPGGFGVNPWLLLAVQVVIVAVMVRFLGKKLPEENRDLRQ